MRRLFWVALGATAGVLVVRRVTRAAQAYTPEGMARSLSGLGDGLRELAAAVPREGCARGRACGAPRAELTPPPGDGRQTRPWLRFFAERGHVVVPSASLVSDDPTLLFTVAGMVPFIPYLTAQQTAPWPRATSVQKCVRTLDIEEVGKTTRHGTFFQMNGNFSFGDYFKEGAIAYAWELVTGSQDRRRLRLRPGLDLGHGLPGRRRGRRRCGRRSPASRRARIQRRGMKDNYWSTGQPGPAGPCSEIYFDRGPAVRPRGRPDRRRGPLPRDLEPRLHAVRARPGQGKDDFEILGDLPTKNIDTGMGLERVASLLQGVDNLYEIDEVYPVIERARRSSPAGATARTTTTTSGCAWSPTTSAPR